MPVFWITALCSPTVHHSNALMMEAESTSETSANFYQTTLHNNPEDSHL
jgi:hypothetical protein